ncbi:hypothetical protein CBM2615_U40009 [Cupriavidus taiwanensis]|nr:hypothetical protein CBM2615_U40009 [Cupriavidus taiwanensis]
MRTDMSKSLVEFKRFLAKSAPTLSEHEKKLANLMLGGSTKSRRSGRPEAGEGKSWRN